jgi:hypothetical protein
MLFYGHFGPGAQFTEGMLSMVMRASPERLFAGGLVGPIAACLCIAGFWHAHLNIRPSTLFVGRLMLVLFSLLRMRTACGDFLMRAAYPPSQVTKCKFSSPKYGDCSESKSSLFRFILGIQARSIKFPLSLSREGNSPISCAHSPRFPISRFPAHSA